MFDIGILKKNRLDDEISHREIVDHNTKMIIDILIGYEYTSFILFENFKEMYVDKNCVIRMRQNYLSRLGYSVYAKRYDSAIHKLCSLGIQPEQMTIVASKVVFNYASNNIENSAGM